MKLLLLRRERFLLALVSRLRLIAGLGLLLRVFLLLGVCHRFLLR